MSKQEGNPLTSRDEEKRDYFLENFVNITQEVIMESSRTPHETKNSISEPFVQNERLNGKFPETGRKLAWNLLYTS